MAGTGLRIAGDGTDMWRAWVGFNFSHSLGLFIFCAYCVLFALSLDSLSGVTFARHPGLLRALGALPVAVGLAYLWLAVQYWFFIPALGVGIGTICLAIGWLLF